MATVEQTDQAAPTREAPVLVLADVATDTERGLVAAWARSAHPHGRVVEQDGADLDAALRQADGASVVPVRVTWLPRERDGVRDVRVTDLLALTNPRRPWAPLQGRIADREPDRVRVVVGEPATVEDLRRRCVEETGGAEALDAFVRRQAVVACDRAERQIIGDRYKVPRLVAEQILASVRFREELEQLARRLDRPFDELLVEAQACLEEVATVQSPPAIDAFRAFVKPMHARAWTPVLESADLAHLKDLNRSHALVFLPSHRSYVDPLVLADVFHEHDLPRTHIIGGDNMGFWPLGPLGKRAGVVFIRRSFGSDEVYKLAVRAFLGHLVAKRFNLEWYLEGGRTRTGKLRPPRYGLLAYIAAALEDGQADDVILVPTSLAYDRQSEVAAMTAEQTGAVKQREGLAWMYDYIKAQSSNVGYARVNFGDPFSLREAMEEAGEGRSRLEKVAFQICVGINSATPVTGTSLVTLALLGSRDQALTLDEIARATAPLLDYCEARGTPGPLTELRRPRALRQALDSLVDAGALQVYEGGTEPVWTIAPGGHHVAAFYRNGALHHFVNRAVVELALLRVAAHPEDGDPLDVAWEDALRLRDLLKFEFFFADKALFREELREELDRLDPSWADKVQSADAATDVLLDSRMLVAHRALRSFLDAQWIVASQLAGMDPRSAVDRNAFLDACQGIGKQHVLQGHVHGAESVSRELFASAMKLAANRDILDPGREEVRDGRRAWVAELEEVITRLRTIDGLDQRLLEGVLGQ